MAAAGDENYLLLLVEAASEQGTAQFKASDIKALFGEAVEQCSPANWQGKYAELSFNQQLMVNAVASLRDGSYVAHLGEIS